MEIPRHYAGIFFCHWQFAVTKLIEVYTVVGNSSFAKSLHTCCDLFKKWACSLLERIRAFRNVFQECVAANPFNGSCDSRNDATRQTPVCFRKVTQVLTKSSVGCLAWPWRALDLGGCQCWLR